MLFMDCGFGRPDPCLAPSIMSALIIPQEAYPASSGRKRHLYTRPVIVLKGE